VNYDADQNWCPKPSVKVSHQWTSSPKIEILHRVNVSVSGAADKMMKGIKNKADT
jgi:hypothetical protein